MQEKRRNHGNTDSLSELRGRHEPGGLGGHPPLLYALWGTRRRGGPRLGCLGGPAGTNGVGAGLAAGSQPCVARWLYWRPWLRPDAPDSVWGCPGICLNWPFCRRPPPGFGGRWSGFSKVDVLLETYDGSGSSPKPWLREIQWGRTGIRPCGGKSDFPEYEAQHIVFIFISHYTPYRVYKNG